jgi:branched-chain amino acid transport system ATP-binding protein
MLESALEVRSVTKLFGQYCALSDLSLMVRPGTVHAVIGPNGAGKSTLAGIAAGDVTATSGSVHLGEVDITRKPVWYRARCGVGRGYQVAQLFDSLTVSENLLIASGRGGNRRAPAAVERAVELVDLKALLRSQAKGLSGGDRKRVEFGMLVAQAATLLILDEPTAGMSGSEALRTKEAVAQLKAGGASFLLIEHDMDVVAELADEVSVLNFGSKILTGSMREVINSEAVQAVYLGVRESSRLASDDEARPAVDSREGGPA